jgi:phage protein D
MNMNKHLVPVCIIYIDGNRLDLAYEGAFRSIRVLDKLNGVSRCNVTFDCGEIKLQNDRTIGLGSWITVQMGYKDDTDEVFDGEIVARRVKRRAWGSAEFEITGVNTLQRLGHGVRNRRFEKKSYSQAITEIVEKHGLRADTESFGRKIEHWEGGPRTDLDLVLELARRYGRDVYCYGNKVYVKEQMMVRLDEIIYEWGRSLISFRGFADISKQISVSRYIGWDILKGEKFVGEKGIGDVTQKVGGSKDWTKISKGGSGKWKDTMVDYGLLDRREAEERALGKLREKSFQFMRAEGSAEGNSRLMAGMRVEVKGAGGLYSGEYIAEYVIHEFSLISGYITTFGLKRNMVDEGFQKEKTVVDKYVAAYHAQRRAEREQELSGGGKGSAGEEEEERAAEERAPGFSNLRWMKGGKEIREALVDDEVTLNFDVRNINNGEKVEVGIWEHDDDQEHDHVKDVRGEVQNGQVEIKWKVEYTDDNDDSTSGKELAEKGYTLPEYHFVAKYGRVKSEAGPVLKVKGWTDRQVVYEKTGEIAANRNYTLILPDGEKITNRTDENGFIRETGLPFGEMYFYLAEDKNE